MLEVHEDGSMSLRGKDGRLLRFVPAPKPKSMTDESSVDETVWSHARRLGVCPSNWERRA